METPIAACFDIFSHSLAAVEKVMQIGDAHLKVFADQ